jgi:3-hydroxybutyryl-CoA dehydrogenase
MSQPGASDRDRALETFPEEVGIAGSGTIACGLAACIMGHGGAVVMWARSEDSVRRARKALARQKHGHELTVTTDRDALAAATLVVEAVAEEPDLKNKLLPSVRGVLGDQALLATTTSSLKIDQLARASGDAAHFFGLHVFNPVAKMKLVELCFPADADGAVRGRATAFCEALGKIPVEVPDEPGFVVNRLLFPYLFDAVRLLERTGMEPEQVDACMKLGASHPMGPLQLLDLVGIDVAEAIGDALYGDTGDPAHRPPGRIKELVARGRLGRKAGAGFYDYGSEAA